MTLIAALIVAGAVAWGALQIAGELRASRDRAGRGDQAGRAAHAVCAGARRDQQDPRAFLVWQPMAKAARQLFPDEFARLDRAIGRHVSILRERIEAAHAQWTADWLAWELAHDTEFKLKAAIAEQDLATDARAGCGRARLDAIEREKLDLYQRRYADYVRTAKALQALIGS